MTSSLLLSLTTFAYLLCTVLYLSGTIFRFKPLLGAGAVSGAAALLMQTAGIGLRWIESYRWDTGMRRFPTCTNRSFLRPGR